MYLKSIFHLSLCFSIEKYMLVGYTNTNMTLILIQENLSFVIRKLFEG